MNVARLSWFLGLLVVFLAACAGGDDDATVITAYGHSTQTFTDVSEANYNAHGVIVAGSALDPRDSTLVDPLVDLALNKVREPNLRRHVAQLVNKYTRHTGSGDMGRGKGIIPARQYILTELGKIREQCQRPDLVIDQHTFVHPGGSLLPGPTEIVNTYAVLPGVVLPGGLQNRYVAASCHLDSVQEDSTCVTCPAPGANDNATGCAALLEAMRALACSGRQFPVSIAVVFFTGEEQGLLGSAEFAKNELPRLGWNLQGGAFINADMIGGEKAAGVQSYRYLDHFSDGWVAKHPASPLITAWLSAVVHNGANISPSAQLTALMLGDVRRRLQFPEEAFVSYPHDEVITYGLSDNRSISDYAGVAVPVCFNIDKQIDEHHIHEAFHRIGNTVYGDTLPFVDFGMVTRAAQLLTGTLANLAAAPPPPDDACHEEDNFFQDYAVISWTHPAERPYWQQNGRSLSYQVLARRPSTLFYQYVFDAGMGQRKTLPAIPGETQSDWTYLIRSVGCFPGPNGKECFYGRARLVPRENNCFYNQEFFGPPPESLEKPPL